MLQFSLRNLLIAVAAVAVGTAALLNANEWWASLLWAAALLMSMFAGFVAFFRREAQRAFWSGYVVAGSMYLLLLMYSVPQMSSTNTWMPLAPLNYSNLATTKVTVWAYSRLPTSKTTPNLPAPPTSTRAGGMAGGGGMSGFGGGGQFFTPTLLPPNPDYIDQNAFIQIGHALWIFFLSWLGGTVAFLLYRSRGRSSPPPATASP